MPPGPSALVHPYPLPVSVQLSFLSPFLLDLCPLVEIASIRGRREKILAMPHLSHQQAIINNCNIHFFSSLISFQNPAPTYGKRIPFVFMGGLGLHCRRRTIHPRSPSPSSSRPQILMQMILCSAVFIMGKRERRPSPPHPTHCQVYLQAQRKRTKKWMISLRKILLLGKKDQNSCVRSLKEPLR